MRVWISLKCLSSRMWEKGISRKSLVSRSKATPPKTTKSSVPIVTEAEAILPSEKNLDLTEFSG